jgi:exodeoxyribonuclease VII small subunit
MFIDLEEEAMADAGGATEVTFEAGYDELKTIVARLDAEDVSVHEMCELFARGKGLEKALRGYLTTQQGKLDEIEAGENLPEFRIVAPSDAGGARSEAEFGRSPLAKPGAGHSPPDSDIPF